MTEPKQNKNPPEEPQQKSSWAGHTPPKTPPPDKASHPGTKTTHRAARGSHLDG